MGKESLARAPPSTRTVTGGATVPVEMNEKFKLISDNNFANFMCMGYELRILSRSTLVFLTSTHVGAPSSLPSLGINRVLK